MMTAPTRPAADRLPRSSRRLAVFLALAVTVPLGAVACAKQPSDPAQQVNLSIFWWGGPAREQVTRQALALYTKKHPNVTFTMKSQPNSGYYDSLQKMIDSGNAPDIFQIDDNRLADYASRRQTLNLSPYLGAGKAIDDRKVPESLVAYGTIDRKPYAVAIAENTPALVYDKTVARRYGVPEPEIGWSYQQLFSWARKITRASDGKVGGTVSASSNYKALWLWLRAQGKEYYLDGHIGFSVSDLQRWFELWADAERKEATLPPVPGSSGNNDVTKQPLVLNEAATAFVWSNQLAELQKATDHELGITAYPGDPRGQWARASMYWAIHSASKQQAAAAAAIDFLINDVACGKILGTDRGLPANTDVRQAVAGSASPVMRQTLELESTLTPMFGAAPPPPPKAHSKVTELLVKAADDVQYERATPEVAAYNFVRQAQEVLN